MNSLISSFTERATPPCVLELGGKESNLRCRIQSPVPCQLGYRPRPRRQLKTRPLRKRRRLVFTSWEVNTMRHKLLARKAACYSSRVRRFERVARAAIARAGALIRARSRRPSRGRVQVGDVDVVTATDRRGRAADRRGVARGRSPTTASSRRSRRRGPRRSAYRVVRRPARRHHQLRPRVSPLCGLDRTRAPRASSSSASSTTPSGARPSARSAEAGRSLNGAPDRGVRRRRAVRRAGGRRLPLRPP